MLSFVGRIPCVAYSLEIVVTVGMASRETSVKLAFCAGWPSLLASRWRWMFAKPWRVS